MEEIINRVAESGIKTINLENLIPAGKRSEIDLKDQLFQGLVLRENEFRQFIKDTDWPSYKDQYVNVYCSADAIIPNWTYMLIASKLAGVAKHVVFGNKKELEKQILLDTIKQINKEDYANERVIIKGCSEEAIAEEAYLNLTLLLTPVVKSLMFGEPCSAVPVYKRK
jgi:hypothetical protein